MMDFAMIVVIGVIVLGASVMSGLYLKTKRPKFYAFLGAVLGGAALLVISGLSGGAVEINYLNAAFSAVFGIPGAVFVWAVPFLGSI